MERRTNNSFAGSAPVGSAAFKFFRMTLGLSLTFAGLAFSQMKAGDRRTSPIEVS